MPNYTIFKRANTVRVLIVSSRCFVPPMNQMYAINTNLANQLYKGCNNYMNSNIYCPIIMYTCFTNVKKCAKDIKVYISKFESDINTILSHGYTPISLSQLSDAMSFNSPLPPNPICIIMFGGYKNQYKYAYPILLKYGVHADFFIPTELVGANSYPGIAKFEPHFAWEDAVDMYSSKLADIYAMWHPFDSGKDYFTEIQNKTKLISAHIPGSNPQNAFFIEMEHDTLKKQCALDDAKIGLNIVNYYSPFANKYDKGHVPYIDIKQESNILDILDSFAIKYNYMMSLDRNFDSIDNIQLDWIPPNNSIFLPIDKDPPIKNLLRNAIPLSVIGASRKDKSEMIVLNDFIEIVFRPWYHYFDYDNHHYFCWPQLTCCRLERDFIRRAKINVADFVINGLETGYYVDASVDEYYIQGKINFNRQHLAHNILIYGYDCEQNVFRTLTYTKSGYYEDLEVSPCDFIKSCASEYFGSIQFLKNDPTHQITYDIISIRNKLKRYTESEYEYANNTKYSKYDPNQSYNYNASLEFSRYIHSVAEKDNFIYLVCFCGYLEHKRIMGWRINYLAEKEELANSKYSAYQEYSKKTTEHLINLALKFNVNKNKNILNRITRMIEELNEKELEVIQLFLAESCVV